FLQIPPTLTIVAGISTWHIHSHRKECYARYSPLFIKGSGWVDGEIIETLWSTLNIVSASTHSMTAPHRQELLDFQMNDSNFMKMIQMIDSLSQKLKAVWASVVLARESFDRLDVAVMPAQQMIWKKQEEAALNEHICDPLVMDTFEIQLKRAPTVHAMEIDLLEKSKQLGIDHGTASWITHIAMDMLGEEETFSNGRESNGSVDDILDMETPIGQTPSFLPLPSKFGMDECQSMGVHQLVDMELKLCMGQANDALHGLHLALADKAVIFKSVVRPAMNYSMRTQAWQMIHSVDHSIKQYAVIYRRCQDSMIWLGASQDILDRYQELINSDLATSAAAFTQGAHYHCTSQLPWFWTIDIPRDTNSKSWLIE
ncbi:hypothetical protein EDC04DRAFT_2523337, partial [Pisolithus marmoratus]